MTLHTGTFAAIFGVMRVQTVQPAKQRRIAPHAAWRQVAIALVLGVLIHHFLMAVPLHERVMPPLTAMQQTGDSTRSDMPGNMPGIRGCSAIEGCLNREASFSLPALALLLTAAVVPVAIVLLAFVSNRRCSARRHRAFLQVFLC